MLDKMFPRHEFADRAVVREIFQVGSDLHGHSRRVHAP
jgi:hypothetical protein